MAVGCNLYLHKAWSQSRVKAWRFVQNLLGYDFYIDRLYRVTVVGAVIFLSRISAWCDRYLIDGLVNLVGFATIFSGQGLKYSISGESQGYLLVILLGVSSLGFFTLWYLGLLDNLLF